MLIGGADAADGNSMLAMYLTFAFTASMVVLQIQPDLMVAGVVRTVTKGKAQYVQPYCI